MPTFLDLLVIQGCLGAYDVLWHHEWKECLPERPQAIREQKLHGVRELLYAVAFVGLAWWRWQGAAAWLLAGILAVEMLITGWDFVEEDRSRRLSPTERVTHLVLSMNGGAYLVLLYSHWLEWNRAATGFALVDYGIRSWLLTALGLGVFAWGLRDCRAGWRPPIPADAMPPAHAREV
ncbi:MAG: hypothetical protein FIA97_11130 [Methylococcaceae bacterium]|nr:hypothetical protein [Methylococcaceae bacterium]